MSFVYVHTLVQHHAVSIGSIFSEDAIVLRKIIYKRISVIGQYTGDTHVLYVPSVIDIPDPPDELDEIPLTPAGVFVNYYYYCYYVCY